MKKILPILFILCTKLCFGQLSPDQYFGDSYSEALAYIKKNKNTFQKIGKEYCIDPKMISAIVFPELIRYSRFRDFAETTALELLYIKYGKSIADFSIGRFQIKPSFIEDLENFSSTNYALKEQLKSIVEYNTVDSTKTRKIRLERLKDENWQFIYLSTFVTIAQRVYADHLTTEGTNNLLILSSAYNRGLNATYEELCILAKTKTFPYGNLPFGRYSYYDVANHYYTNYSHKIFGP